MESTPLPGYENTVMKERLEMAATWLATMPRFPPNCVQMDITMKYDDGKTLAMEIGQQED